jgi:hypothetical protein
LSLAAPVNSFVMSNYNNEGYRLFTCFYCNKPIMFDNLIINLQTGKRAPLNPEEHIA